MERLQRSNAGMPPSSQRMEEQLPHLYDVHMMEQYNGASFGELSPHLFAVADTCYSRFGKFVEIQFDKYGKISGAAVRTYLLERSRVCQVSDPERNYHCFYMLCSAPPEDVKRFKVGDPRTFHYLNQTNCYEVANVDDAREYLLTRHAMDVVGINQDEQDAIFGVVAAILHLGNINFAKGKEIDSSRLKDEKSAYHLKTAAELLMCNEKSLQESLCERVIVTPDGNITKLLDPDAAALSRDAFAKTIYSRLFDCMFPKSTHETFAQKLYQTYKAHKRFSKPKLARTAFTINHYAGDQQLQSLMETLSTTEPHYIRCVKPNTVLKPGIFENFNVLNQLRCGVSKI
ncbi:hypothetical protein KSP40_PGU019918 [Platanthera guangdongensis]|uniref:Myosin motor domain-containing protein n=1 Tax=Platanthera guangdongensis TaxID=2320717 RepID=A0ABR2MGA4_9ASPA